MPTISSSQLNLPKNWDEFEEMCADLFMREWGDRNAVRHGRHGQGQNGVDIYGKSKGGGYVGVQCKGKRKWPPTVLTISEIDAEVVKARAFRPALSELIFATTAPDDTAVQAHARAITERHSKEGLFSVHVFGWGELTRRLACYPELIGKHYPYITHDSIRNEIILIPQKIADIMTATNPCPVDLVDNEIEKRMEALRKKRYFGGSDSAADAKALSDQIQSGELKGGSNSTKSRALAWCARILSITDSTSAEDMLKHASQLAQCEEVDIAVAFISAAKGEYKDALARLPCSGSPVSRSAAFIIVANSQGVEKAFDWIEKAQLDFDDLDPDGKFIFLSKCIVTEKWSILIDHANTLSDNDLSQTPALLFVAAIANLAQTVPSEFMQYLIGQVPFEVDEFPLASDSQAISFRRKAGALFEEYTAVAESLGLKHAANVASDYALWLKLRDSEQSETAKEKLRVSMHDPAHSLRRLNLALKFGIKLDLEAVNREIDRQTALTFGNSVDASFARSILAFTQKTPGDIADYISRYRDEISRHVDKMTLGKIEAEMLARAGRVGDADQRLKELQRDGLDKETETKLKRIISGATDNDPVNAWIEEYQSDQSLYTLTNLVNLLEERKDWERLCRYGALLFNRTRSRKDAERLADALNKTRRYTTLADLLRKYPEFRIQSDFLQALWCWVLYREGAVQDWTNCLKVLQEKRDDPCDRSLAVNLAIASGNWESLATIVEEEWEKRNSRTAPELLRAAQLAQVLGSQRTANLVRSAVQKADRDPNVYLGAYSIATSDGWENTPEAGEWLLKGIEYSDDNGPIRRMSLKDIIERQPDWEHRESDTWLKLKNSELPIFGAACLLNRSLVDLFLFPALANPNEIDPRRRLNIYAYSGVRQPLVFDAKTVGLDATSLLTLMILGVVKETLDTFDKIVMPHSTLSWLFEEKEKAKFHQPSRIRDARALRQLLDEGALHPFVSSASDDSDLVAEVGEELATLIAETEIDAEKDRRQRIVVRSYPVHRAGSLMDEEADLSRYQKCLCSCTAVIEKLKQKGQLTAAEEKRSRAYLSANEKRWPSESEIADGAVLYLSHIAVHYFQHLGLLQKLRAAGFTAFVSEAMINETKALIRYESLTAETSRKIEELRTALAEGIRSGKVKLGPLPSLKNGEQDEFRLHPTVNIFEIADLVDAVVIDDRCMNRHQHITANSKMVPIVTSWDLFNALYSWGKLDFESILEHRTKLRRAGFLLVPVDDEELHYQLTSASINDNVLSETAELKAVRENILQARMTGIVTLPNEANWLNNVMHVMMRVLKSQWTLEIDDDVARARSNWLLQFLDLRGWSPALGQEGGSRMASDNYKAQIIMLLSPPDKASTEVRDRYWHWIEDTIIEQLKRENPNILSEVGQYYKELIGNLVDECCQQERIVPENESVHRTLAAYALQFLPPFVRDALLSDRSFLDKYGFTIDLQLSIGDSGVRIDRSKLFDAIRTAFHDLSAHPVVYDTSNVMWKIEVIDALTGKIAIYNEKQRILSSVFWPLLQQTSLRLAAFDKVAETVNLPQDTLKLWRIKLDHDPVDNSNVNEMIAEIGDTPISFIDSIKIQLEQRKNISLSSLVPNSARYFPRLIGPCGNYHNLTDYVSHGIKGHIEQLISWHPQKGLSLALLLSAHSSIVPAIDLNKVGLDDTVIVFRQIAERGDLLSQIGAIEVGLSKVQDWPEIEPYLIKMIEQIRDDDPNEERSRFRVLSSLIMLVDGQLSYSRIFKDKPPFWRRLASIAHASMIARCFVHFPLNETEFSNSVLQSSGEQFYFQSLCDLRHEPKWMPDFVSANQLKADFVGRICDRYQHNADVIEALPSLRDLLSSDSPKGIGRIVEFPFSFYPGMLEGGTESTMALPKELVEAIQNNLAAEKLEPALFNTLINSALIYKIETVYAELTVKALRKAKYYVNQGESLNSLFHLLSGLAMVAAVTRSTKMANELRILTHRSMRSPGNKITPDQVIQIALISAASYVDLKAWCSFIGEWLTELAFSDLKIKDAERFYLHVKCLSHIEPELWPTLGRAEAALTAFISR